jgi:hypothetical protein
MKSVKVKAAMNEFAEAMSKVYFAAEGLRDCTEDGHEKQVFNDTRNALHELRHRANKLAHKWETE